ncbi:MAG: hypothetical protein WC199_10430, partial [Dysgonamonadaceae bacterium]
MFGILLLLIMFAGLGILGLGIVSAISSGITTNKTFIVIGFVLFLFGCVGSSLVTTVDAGHVGIEKTFGAVSDNIYNPGLIIKAPWVEIVPFNVQQHESSQTIAGGS